MNTLIGSTSGTPVSPEETSTPPSKPGKAKHAPPGKARIAIGFLLRDPDPRFVVTSGNILGMLDGNPAYPTPSPALADVIAARDAYVAAMPAASDSSIAVNLRRQKRAALVALLRELAMYVQLTSAGDLPTLRSSGFPVQRTRQPIGPLAAPTGLRLVRGKLSGQIHARCSKTEQAGAYQWRCAPTATPDAWLPVITTLAASARFEGLALGTSYGVQACAIGTSGPSDWSDVVTLIVA